MIRRCQFFALIAAIPAALSGQEAISKFESAPFHVLTIEDHPENENLEFKIRAAVFARIPNPDEADAFIVEKIQFPKGFKEPIQLVSPFDPIADSSIISISKDGVVESGLILDLRDGWTSFSLRTKSETEARSLLSMLKFEGKTREGKEFSFQLLNLRGGANRPDTGKKDLARSAIFLEHGAFEAVDDPKKSIRFSPSSNSLDLNSLAISADFEPGFVRWNPIKDKPHQVTLIRADGESTIIELIYTPGGQQLPTDFPNDEDWKEATMIYFKLDGSWFHNSGSMMF